MSGRVGEEVSICVGCGLCCDGTVLSHLAVADESDLGAPLRALGVELIVQADPPVFALPCPAVHDGVCTVYDRHRPDACGRFRCDLLMAVDAGEVAVAEARAVIADTLVLRDRVAAGAADEGELSDRVRDRFRSA